MHWECTVLCFLLRNAKLKEQSLCALFVCCLALLVHHFIYELCFSLNTSSNLCAIKDLVSYLTWNCHGTF